MNAQTISQRYETVAKFVAPALASLLAFPPPQFNVTFLAWLKCVGLTVLCRFAFDLLKPALLRPLLKK